MNAYDESNSLRNRSDKNNRKIEANNSDGT